jgi:hypothetical protein
MNRRAPQSQVEAGSLVNWEFTRGADRLSCRVDRDPASGAFAVAVITGLRRVSVESYHAVAGALGHHAALASALRASGWKVAAYTA